MKMQSLYNEYHNEFMASSQEYCCYCLEQKTGHSCCQENHFVTFKDLYPEDQREIINAELEHAFEGAKQ